MIPRERCEAAFRKAVESCDPDYLVYRALNGADHWPAPLPETSLVAPGRRRFGIAIGKAALKMARGAGEVALGVAVTNADDGRPLPDGWRRVISSHPVPDDRSLAAATDVIDVVASAGPEDVVLALISGGASALVERPLPGVTLEQIQERVRELVNAGASIHEVNAARAAMSAIKGGKLGEMSVAPVLTLAISDVPGDDISIIGSGPTFAGRPQDRAAVIARRSAFASGMWSSLGGTGITQLTEVHGDIDRVLKDLLRANRPVLAFGEPTLTLPANHGEGGRAQHLALALAQHLRGGDRSAFVAGSDGQDGPAPAKRPAPAGAYVDGSTWDAIVAAGIDPARALARRDAGTALNAVGALFISGPTGVNHADVIVIG